MSAQSAFPFAVLAIGLGVALHHLRDAEGSAGAAALLPETAIRGDSGVEAREVVPVALRRTVESQGLFAGSAGIDVRLVDGRVVRADNLDASGTRRTCEVEPSEHGIEFPDGTRLPLLNGLHEVPPIEGRGRAAPVAPVIAIVVDADGWEWYEHADGSRSTSRLQAIVPAVGATATVRPVALHEATGARGVPAEGTLRKGRANLER